MTTVYKSPSDRKQYRVITLSNGFRALLISDECHLNENGKIFYGDGESSLSGVPKTTDDLEETGVSCVADDESLTDGSLSEESDVGSSDGADSDDIDNAQMVFMGNEKYPNENDFHGYLSENGGSYNAQTECEETVFHFDVQKQYLHGALDRFAQSFMHPLLKKDSLKKEIEAVNNEFLQIITSDACRVEQLLGSLANKGHPMSKFMWGNEESLKQQSSDEKDLHSKLMSFYMQYYQPQYMTLAVLSQDSLDDLENLVREIFSPMEQGSLQEVHVIPSFAQEIDTQMSAHVYHYDGAYNEMKQRHGPGVANFPNGDMYEGEYQFGKRHGKGIYRFANGDVYDGEWYMNKKQGHGVFTHSNNSRYEGEWLDDKREGYGKYVQPNGDYYVGPWRNHVRHGHGKYVYATSRLQWVGEWRDGQRFGDGKVTTVPESTDKATNGNQHVCLSGCICHMPAAILWLAIYTLLLLNVQQQSSTVY